VAIAMLASLVVALTSVPVLAHWCLRAPQAARDRHPDDERAVAAVPGAAAAQEERSRLHRLHTPQRGWALAHKLIPLGEGEGTRGGTVAMYPQMKSNILGDTGQNMAAYTQTLPAGTTLEESSEKAVDAEDALMDIDGVDVVQTTIGGS